MTLDRPTLIRMVRAHYNYGKGYGPTATNRWATFEEACKMLHWLDDQIAAMKAALAEMETTMTNEHNAAVAAARDAVMAHDDARKAVRETTRAYEAALAAARKASREATTAREAAYELLKATGHSVAKAAEIVLNTMRGDCA